MPTLPPDADGVHTPDDLDRFASCRSTGLPAEEPLPGFDAWAEEMGRTLEADMDAAWAAEQLLRESEAELSETLQEGIRLNRQLADVFRELFPGLGAA